MKRSLGAARLTPMQFVVGAAGSRKEGLTVLGLLLMAAAASRGWKRERWPRWYG
jgi:hypothetical protein